MWNNKNNRSTLPYMFWKNILTRCFDKKVQIKYPTYKNCYICDEWLSFANFCIWFDENFYQVENERMELDKDILMKGNKIYFPERCIFVPQSINTLLTKQQNDRGLYKIGVTNWCGDFVYQISKGDKRLIYKCRSEEGFKFYKTEKERYIKEIANRYKENIPLKLYYALINYCVDIDD